MANNVFPKSMQRPGKSKVETTTLRGWSGGWNAIDDDKMMAPRYCVELINFIRQPSGGQKVRYGSQFLKDIKSVRDSDIVDMVYFNGRIVVVTESSNILTITDGGTVTEIWNSAIAASLPGAPSTWNTGTEQVVFVPHKSRIVVHNGQDKPVIISSAFAVSYLQDDSTGSNVNVPIGKYGCVVANYHCVAGIDGSPTEIVISAAGTAGVFPGDPAPNDSISLDVGAYAPEGAAAIRGIAGYRTNLIVFLQGMSIQITLGEYEGTTHTPRFPDTFPKFGLIGQRCITTIENDLIFGGLGGLSSAKRNIYTQSTLDASYISNVIEPEYRRIVAELTDAEQLVDAFTVYDPLGRNHLLFIKEGVVLCYTSNEKLNYKGWSRLEGMDFRCGCTSFLGRVFVADGTRIFQLGNKTFGEEFYADRELDRDYEWTSGLTATAGDLVFDTLTEESYVVNVTHTMPLMTFEEARDDPTYGTYYTLFEGDEIEFVLEMPWFSGKDAMRTKKMLFIAAASNGTAEFTVDCYVDNLYKDENGDVVYDPAVSLTFTGNDTPGYGLGDGPYGGGRRSGDPRLFKYPAKFKTAKFRIHGTATQPLELNMFMFLFSRGKYFR